MSKSAEKLDSSCNLDLYSTYCKALRYGPCVSLGITQFYLPPTHEPYLPLLPSRRTAPPFGFYSAGPSLRGWVQWGRPPRPGGVDLGSWLYTDIGFLQWKLTQDTVINPITHRAWCRVTLLIETSALSQTSSSYVWRRRHLLLNFCVHTGRWSVDKQSVSSWSGRKFRGR